MAARSRTSKKKAARGKKPAPRKKASVKARTKRPAKARRPPARPDPHPSNLQTQLDVWAAYARLRSRRAVAAELGIAEWIVREVVNSDLPRLTVMIDEALEDLVAAWESTGARAQRQMQDLLDITGGLLAEIKAAAAEGRVTTIRDRDGYPMPVLDAVQFVVMTRLLDQMARIAERAQAISTGYRNPGGGGGSADPQRAGGTKALEAMDDIELCRVIEAAGLPLPPTARRKLKLIESKSAG